MLIGSHCSSAGGVDQALERGLSLGCECIQIFVQNNNKWKSSPLKATEIENFRTLWANNPSLLIISHAGYLVNLSATKPENIIHSSTNMREELERCEALGIPWTVMHPGSALERSPDTAMEVISETLNALFTSSRGYKVGILLETTAGQGTNIGWQFEQLAQIINNMNDQQRIGICYDTCHSHSAGYDLTTKDKYAETWEHFDQTIGIAKYLRAFHLNDSKNPFGSRKDRHEHIGDGTLGLPPFRLLMNDPRFALIPGFLETPKDEEMAGDRRNINILHGLRKSTWVIGTIQPSNRLLDKAVA